MLPPPTPASWVCPGHHETHGPTPMGAAIMNKRNMQDFCKVPYSHSHFLVHTRSQPTPHPNHTLLGLGAHSAFICWETGKRR